VSEQLKVVPIPLWRTGRRAGVLLVLLGGLVILFGVGLYADSLELEDSTLRQQPPSRPLSPRPSESSPPTT
jgi:hypothetical protein